MNTDPELGDNLEALSTLADMGYIDKDSAAFGIAQQYFHEGFDSLSEKQRAIFNKHISPVIGKACGVCGEGIEMSALPNAYEEGKMLCSYHMYQFQKDD
ncbi:hypothetical protein [Shewanella chilikensis]|uniref:hypothetical protein n=1 Tax=Shewanella chilikensis TaxID=558541 RepID=UPI003003E5D4